MFDFLKIIMNKEGSIFNNDETSLHRVLKTDIKKDTNVNEDEIIFGCGCFWGAENAFGNFQG